MLHICYMSHFIAAARLMIYLSATTSQEVEDLHSLKQADLVKVLMLVTISVTHLIYSCTVLKTNLSHYIIPDWSLTHTSTLELRELAQTCLSFIPLDAYSS